MNVFITGATGVLGRIVTRLLVDTGHSVRALARNSSNESRLRSAGAEPVKASLFDPPSLRSAADGCDAILHLATRIPPSNRAVRHAAWEENDRIRTQGTWNLMDAALEVGVSTFVSSIVFFYPGFRSELVGRYSDAGAYFDPAVIAEGRSRGAAIHACP